MSMVDLFREVVNGHIKDYRIKNPQKLEAVAQSIGIETEGREMMDIAQDLYKELERTYTQVEGEIPFAKRVPPKTLELWRKHGLVPRGAMREIMELMHRSHMGVDQDYTNITKQCSRTALADGWGGSMVATEISDILFGIPTPVSIEVNMGVLKEDHVNIIVHGHEPNLFESMIESVGEPTLVQAAKAAGAKGLNLCGMCCSGAEVLVRHGIPHAGNFMSTEAIIVTGAVDVMCVDVQCIKQGLAKVADCYGTKLITTNPRCHIEGATHIEFHERTPKECTDEVVLQAIGRFKNRTAKIEIPKIKNVGVHGFSHEYINYMLGGSFRGSYVPLNDNIINGRIRGVAGVVGCTNPRMKQDWVHVELVKELIKNDVLVLQTGCSQIALAKAGLTTPEAAHLAGPGLKEVCETVGMPPVLGHRLLRRQQPHPDRGLGDGQDRRPRRLHRRSAGGRLRAGVYERKGHLHRTVFRGLRRVHGFRRHLPDRGGHQVPQAPVRGSRKDGHGQVGFCHRSARDCASDHRAHRQEAQSARHRQGPRAAADVHGRPPVARLGRLIHLHHS